MKSAFIDHLAPFDDEFNVNNCMDEVHACSLCDRLFPACYHAFIAFTCHEMQSKHPGEKYPGSNVVACSFSRDNRWEFREPGYAPPFFESKDLENDWADPPATAFDMRACEKSI